MSNISPYDQDEYRVALEIGCDRLLEDEDLLQEIIDWAELNNKATYNGIYQYLESRVETEWEEENEQ